ncbi:MAG: hypothetical protein NXI01_03915 [Gammaproteobacteria bacterium]|nr:hypothetical protein [Gammaproteobacteria bacterium]
MIFGGAMIVYSFLNRAASWQLFPWIGASLYIIAFIYTPGPMENMRQGGWGDLEKLHEPAAIMMLSIIWIVSRLATTTQWRMWGIALSFSIAAMIIFSPTMIVFTGAYLSLVFIYFLITKNKPSALWIGKGILVAGAVYTLISVMSYFLTGLPDDQTILQFWPWVNFKKISAWGVPFEVLFLHWSRIGMAANSVPMTQDLIYKILAYIRLDVWGILFILSISCVAFRVIWGAIHKKMTMKFDKSSLYACGGFLFVVIIIAIFIGRDQSISFYRMSTFTYAPMLCVCLLLLDAALKNRILFSIVVLTALILPFNLQRLNSNATSSLQVPLKIIEGYYDVDTMKPIIENGKKFVGGQYSIAQAYKNQQGWPGRMPWGGIYPAAETVWKQLPLKTRIWSMHIHSYCMLPDCHMESYSSFRFTQQPLIVYFGEPAIAKEILKKEGLNYFFFAKTLQLTDPLPRSELFSPQHIADYLGIYWTDGDNTLLTWKEQSKTPLDAAWVRNYASQIKDSAQIASFPSQEIRLALNKYEEISGHAPPDVPWDTKARR